MTRLFLPIKLLVATRQATEKTTVLKINLLPQLLLAHLPILILLGLILLVVVSHMSVLFVTSLFLLVKLLVVINGVTMTAVLLLRRRLTLTVTVVAVITAV